MTSEQIYFVLTLVVATLGVRYIGPLLDRPRTPWRGAIVFGLVVAFIGWAIGT
jgi:hypothetical protein